MPTNIQCLLETGMLPSTQTDRPLQEVTVLIDKPSRMALDNMHGEFLKQTGLHPIDPWDECVGECRAGTFRSNRANANGSRIDDVLTSTALGDSANYLQFPDCDGDSDHNPIVAAINTRSLTLIPRPLQFQISLNPHASEPQRKLRNW